MTAAIAASQPILGPAAPSLLGETVGDHAGLLPEWQALFDRVEGAPWACHPKVFATWARLFRSPASVVLIAVRDGNGRLRGVVPLMRDRVWRGVSATPRFDYDPRDREMVTSRTRRLVPLRQLAPMASLPATMLWVGALCEPEDTEPVVRAVARAVSALSDWDVLVLAVDEDDAVGLWSEALVAAGLRPRLQRLERTVCDLSKLVPFQELVDHQDRNFRRNVKRARAAAEAAGLRLELHAGAKAVEPHLTTLAELARASWKHEGRQGTEVHIPYEGDQRTFFEALIRARPAGLEPVLGLAFDNEGPLGALLFLRHGSSMTGILTFWNGRHKQASPGLLLMAQKLDWGAAEGVLRVHFNGGAPWIRHLADSRWNVSHVVAFAPRPWGRSLEALARWTGRLP